MVNTLIPPFGPYALLVVACSKRKRTDAGVLPASERYDGPVFRLLRRFLAQHPDVLPRIYVLSAEYGFFPCSRPVPVYDRRMTRERARELQPRVRRELLSTLQLAGLRDLYLCAGQDYMPALDGCEAALSSALCVHVATGSVGRRLAQLHDWLYGKPPTAPKIPPGDRTCIRPRIRGVEVLLTREQVLDVARRNMGGDASNARNYQSWYVLVDGHPIAPKWLVSRVSGLPVSSFATDEAWRLLAQLGVEVMRA